MITSRVTITAFWCGILCVTAFLGGYLTGMSERTPGRPEAGATVKAPFLSEDLPIRVRDQELASAGRWLESGNIRFPAFPVAPVVEALGGSVQSGKNHNEVVIRVCNRYTVIRRVDLAERHARNRIHTKWPLQLVESSRLGGFDLTTGAWMRFREVLGSPGWLREALGVEADWHYPHLQIDGCRTKTPADPAKP